MSDLPQTAKDILTFMGAIGLGIVLLAVAALLFATDIGRAICALALALSLIACVGVFLWFCVEGWPR